MEHKREKPPCSIREFQGFCNQYAAMMIDLHCHTYYSDGRFAPEQVVGGAAQRGLRILAITDHDTIRGTREAAPHAAAAGIELITGIEMTTSWPTGRLPAYDANVDVLGYFFDREDAVFDAFTRALTQDIHERITACCALLTERGFPLTSADVFAQNPRYDGALQLIQAIQAKGYAPLWNDALALMESAWYAQREPLFTIKSAIEQVHRASGVAVLAHPTIVRPRGEQMTAGDLRELVDAGLDGIEVYHRRLDEAARAHFLALAREFDLVATGGSDMHGWAHGLDELGTQPVTTEMVDALRARRVARSMHPEDR